MTIAIKSSSDRCATLRQRTWRSWREALENRCCGQVVGASAKQPHPTLSGASSRLPLHKGGGPLRDVMLA